jgi:Insecticidal Crystal Toxin, P42
VTRQGCVGSFERSRDESADPSASIRRATGSRQPGAQRIRPYALAPREDHILEPVSGRCLRTSTPVRRTRLGRWGAAIVLIGASPVQSAPNDPLYSQARNSPFYFIAGQPFWRCMYTMSTAKGGSREISYTAGTSESQSNEFKKSTSMEVSAEVGVVFAGVNAKASASDTSAFELTTNNTKQNSTHFTDTKKFDVPEQDVTRFWQLVRRVSVCRFSGELCKSIECMSGDIRYN